MRNKRAKEPVIRERALCGKPFTVSVSHRKYCSPECMEEAAQKNRRKNSRKRNCGNPGATGIEAREVKGRNVYVARLTAGGKKHYLGTYPTIEDAIAARLDAEARYKDEHGGRGRKKRTEADGVTEIRKADGIVYSARITVDGTAYYLGAYPTIEEAKAARERAKKQHVDGGVKISGTVSSITSAGIPGVQRRETARGIVYDARITSNGKAHHLGTFYTLEEAVLARKKAEERYCPVRGGTREPMSGVTGVSARYTKKGTVYYARITVNGVHHHLGVYDTLEEASEARKTAEKQYGQTKNAP